MQQPLSLSAKTLSIINHILPDGLYFKEHVHIHNELRMTSWI